MFDGISCGQIALERAKIQVDKYYSSEIDKYAIQIAKKNYPKTIQLGDVNNIKGNELPKIDLLIGGSPCQGFSFAGKQLNFEDSRSRLFFEYVRILKEVKPKYFLLENVKMKKEYQDVISQLLGVEPIEINSSLVSAQNRKRLYWTNIPDVKIPKDKGITWNDIKDSNIKWSPIYYNEKNYEWIIKHKKIKDEKSNIYENKTYSYIKDNVQYVFETIDNPSQIIGRRFNEFGKRDDYNKNIKIIQSLEVRGGTKINCLTTVQKDTVISPLPIGRYPDVFNKFEEGKHYRYLTPIECERLQTLPDGYTEGISSSNRYKCLGNGWTVDVISHILSNIVI